MNKKIYIFLLVFVIWGLASCKSDPETNTAKNDETVKTTEEKVVKADEKTEGNVAEAKTDKQKVAMKTKPVAKKQKTTAKKTVKKAEPKKSKPKTVKKALPKKQKPTAKKPATKKSEKPAKADSTKKPAKTKPTEKPMKADPAQKNAEKALAKAESLFNDCKEKKIDSKFSKHFLIAQKDMIDAQETANTKKYPQAKKYADSASNRFSTLINLDSSSKIKNEIVENSFEGYSPNAYTDAEIEYLRAVDNFEKDDNLAKTASSNSLELYSSVRNTGYKTWTKLAKDGANEVKSKCDDIKANKSAKTDYGKALQVMKSGQVAETKKDYKEASSFYGESAEMFTSIFDVVSVKRAEAEKAMRQAKERQEKSSALAEEADVVAPLSDSETINTIEEASESIEKTVNETNEIDEVIKELDEIANEPSNAEGDN